MLLDLLYRFELYLLQNIVICRIAENSKVIMKFFSKHHLDNSVRTTCDCDVHPRKLNKPIEIILLVGIAPFCPFNTYM